MKNKFFSVLSSLFFIAVSYSASAQYHACFTDGYYKFDVSNIVMTSPTTYRGEGTTTAYGTGRVVLLLDFANGYSNGTAEVHVANPSPDGCTYYSDSFTYVGSAVLVKNGPGTLTYSGSGTWVSYCYGGVLNTGYWSAAGPCGASLNAPTAKPGVKPTETKRGAENNSLKISPNPAKDYAHIEYNISLQSKVNVTVYDINGLAVKTLVNESKSAGTYNISWNLLNKNGSKTPPGIYKVNAIINGKMITGNLQVL